MVTGGRTARARAQRREHSHPAGPVRQRGRRGGDPEDLAGHTIFRWSSQSPGREDRTGARMSLDHNASLRQADPTVARLIDAELRRQQRGLELIDSENFASRPVIDALGTPLTNKYAEGLPGKRYYGGCEVVDEVEQLAIDRLKQLFGAQHANVQPHSGAQANAAVMLACLNPGDTILGFDLSHGGHLTHGSPVNFSGKLYRPVFYGVEEATGTIDFDKIIETAEREKPKLIICGA